MSTTTIEKPVATPAPLHPLARKSASEALSYHSRPRARAERDAYFRWILSL